MESLRRRWGRSSEPWVWKSRPPPTNANFDWFSDGGTLPTGGSESLASALVGFFSFVEAVQLTGAALDSAGNDATTYARALAFNIKMATINAIKYLNIYAFLDGSGILAKVGAGVTLSTTVTTVNVAGTIENVTTSAGMTIAFQTGTTSVVRATATIVSTSRTRLKTQAKSQTIVVGPASSRRQSRHRRRYHSHRHLRRVRLLRQRNLD